MIIHKHGSAFPRFGGSNKTVLPFARTAIAGAGRQSLPAARTSAPANPRRDARDRVLRQAALVDLAARGNGLLDDREADQDQDPFTLKDDTERAFDAMAAERFGSIKDQAERASALRMLAPVRARLSARAEAMQENAEDMFFARTVFEPAETVLAAAGKNPVGAGDLMDRVHDLVEQTPLSRDRKDEVAAAVTARAMGLGLESQLSPRFARHKDPARRLLADIARADREAAQPNLLLARAEAPADPQAASPPLNAAQPFVQTAQAQAGATSVAIPRIGTGGPVWKTCAQGAALVRRRSGRSHACRSHGAAHHGPDRRGN